MTVSFTPSPLQAQAIRDIKEWFLDRTDEQQVFRVFGYAGTGKTTITRHAIAELGLDTMTRDADGDFSMSDGVLYAAFTGKAALVMTRKGTPASTIHSLIYRVSEATKEEIDAGQGGDYRDQGGAARRWASASGFSRSRGCAAWRSASPTSTSRGSC